MGKRFVRGTFQKIPDWCRCRYNSYGSTNNLTQQAKLGIPDTKATFCGECIKTCENVVKNFDENRPSCFNVTETFLTIQSSPISFWWNTKWLSIPTHFTTLIWHPVISSYFKKFNWSWKEAGLITMRRSRPNRRECLTLTENDFQEAFQKFRRHWDRCLHAGENTS
jgi:hypothetical protein